jgi:hypothetical protein
MEDGIQKYLDALEAGDTALLEELAIKAGYTERYDGAVSYKNDREQLENETLRFGDILDTASVEEVYKFEHLVKRFFKRYVEKLGGILWMDSDQKLRSRSNSENASEDGVHLLAIALLKAAAEALQRTIDIGNDGDCSFVRVRQSSFPFNRSFVALIAVTSNCRNKKHRPQWLIHDIYDNDPLLEGKLDHGVKTSHLDEFCNSKNRRNEPEEAGRGTLLHEILDEERTRWKTENLIYGKVVIEYLYAHSQGRDSEHFPLSMTAYERLIARRQKFAKKTEMIYADLYSKYDFESVRRMGKEIVGGKMQLSALLEFIRAKMKNPETDKAVVRSLLDCVLHLEKIVSENNDLIGRYHSAYPDI